MQTGSFTPTTLGVPPQAVIRVGGRVTEVVAWDLSRDMSGDHPAGGEASGFLGGTGTLTVAAPISGKLFPWGTRQAPNPGTPVTIDITTPGGGSWRQFNGVVQSCSGTWRTGLETIRVADRVDAVQAEVEREPRISGFTPPTSYPDRYAGPGGGWGDTPTAGTGALTAADAIVDALGVDPWEAPDTPPPSTDPYNGPGYAWPEYRPDQGPGAEWGSGALVLPAVDPTNMLPSVGALVSSYGEDPPRDPSYRPLPLPAGATGGPAPWGGSMTEMQTGFGGTYAPAGGGTSPEFTLEWNMARHPEWRLDAALETSLRIDVFARTGFTQSKHMLGVYADSGSTLVEVQALNGRIATLPFEAGRWAARITPGWDILIVTPSGATRLVRGEFGSYPPNASGSAHGVVTHEKVVVRVLKGGEANYPGTLFSGLTFTLAGTGPISTTTYDTDQAPSGSSTTPMDGWRPGTWGINTPPDGDGGTPPSTAPRIDLPTRDRWPKVKAIPAVSGKIVDVIKDISGALHFPAFVTELGDLRVIHRDDLGAGAPEIINAPGALYDAGWEESLEGLRSRVEVTYREGRTQTAKEPQLRAWQSSEFLLIGSAYPWEEVIEPESDTDWVSVPTGVMAEWANLTAGQQSNPVGNWIGSLDPATGAGKTAVKGVVTRVGPRKWRVTLTSIGTGPYGAAFPASYSKTTTSPWVNQNAPVLRAAGLIRWEEKKTRLEDGPAGEVHSHPAGWVVQTEADAKALGQWIKRKFAEGTGTTLSDLAVLPDPRRQVGDPVRVEDPDNGLWVSGYLTGITQSGAVGVYEQRLRMRVLAQGTL